MIGFGIARRALWADDRCTWFEAVPTLPGQNPAASAVAGCDVYGGTSGIGWFLAQAAARTGDALLRRTARAALRNRLRRAPANMRKWRRMAFMVALPAPVPHWCWPVRNSAMPRESKPAAGCC